MLKIDIENKKLTELDQSSLKTEHLLERYDLQEMMFNSWQHVRKKIGLPTSFLIGKEIKPHETVMDSIDILAFNPDDNSLVVIELKRDRNKYQLLQSLNYAAMVRSWNAQKVIDSIQASGNDEIDELKDVISGTELNPDVGIILIAESYDPEVIITVDWLSSRYEINISAYAIEVHKLHGESFMAFSQRYPLKELSDLYDSRRSLKSVITLPDVTWEEVIPKLEYPFARKAVEMCLKHREGDPKRRRFTTIRTDFDGFKWILISFRKRYVNVYMHVGKEYGAERMKELFGVGTEINEWRDGISINIRTENEFDILAKWLQL